MVGRVLQKEKMVLHRSLALFFVKFFLTTYLVGPFSFLYILYFFENIPKVGFFSPYENNGSNCRANTIRPIWIKIAYNFKALFFKYSLKRHQDIGHSYMLGESFFKKCAYTMTGKKLKKTGMIDPSINYHRCPYTVFNSFYRRFNLWDHS